MTTAHANFFYLHFQGADSFCERVGACSSDFSAVAPVAMYANNTSCDFCINIVTHVKGIVSDPQTEKQLKQALENACNHCPVKDEVSCALLKTNCH